MLFKSCTFEMFSRSTQPASSSNVPPEVEFQNDIEDMFAENLVSAQRIATVFDKATKAGIPGISKKVRKRTGKNQARDLTRHILKNTKWPDYYYFDCRVRDRKTDKEYVTEIPIHLPTEILEALWDLGVTEVLLSEDNLDTQTKTHMDWMKDKLPDDGKPLWGWGMHGDGIPCNYDRTESVIMISLNLPGLSGRNGRLRIPLVILPDFACSKGTFDDINEVLAWAMRHALAGSRPVCRHDGSPWKSSDRKRAKKADTPLPFKSCLNQVRADWDWMGKCFHFPFHNVIEGCCWLCTCKRNQVSWGICSKEYTHIYIYIFIYI